MRRLTPGPLKEAAILLSSPSLRIRFGPRDGPVKKTWGGRRREARCTKWSAAQVMAYPQHNPSGAGGNPSGKNHSTWPKVDVSIPEFSFSSKGSCGTSPTTTRSTSSPKSPQPSAKCYSDPSRQDAREDEGVCSCGSLKASICFRICDVPPVGLKGNLPTERILSRGCIRKLK